MAYSDVPRHLAFAAPTGRLKADFPAQVEARVRELAGETGADVEMVLLPAHYDKTRAQECGFHAMIAPWAKKRGWEVDALKQFLLKKIFGTHDFVDFTTGEVFQVLAEPHTSKLTKVQYSELIEQSMVLAAEDGYYLIAPDEWRKIKADAEKQAARAAKKERAVA